MKPLTIALAATLLVTSGAAAAQSASDAGCILVSNAFARGAKEADQQKTAEATLYFYLGRVSDTMTATQLKALFDQQSKTLTDATAGNVMNNCVKAIQTKLQLLQSIGPAPQQPSQQKKPEGR